MNTDSPRLDAAVLAQLQAWVGRTETLADHITAAPLRGLAATLDLDPLPPGAALPPLWHWLYFLPHHRASEIGPDGHARRGGFLPPVPLPRRMWAGGRFAWQPGNPLKAGDAARRDSRIASVQHKAGRSGDLLFVTVVHEVHNARGLSLTEEHDIVYRSAPQPGDAPPVPVAAPAAAAWRHEWRPDEVMLFRYSALTFNGHRIHYDQPYVTQAEHYPGLIVHGPLIATLLLDLLARQAPGATVERFEFKAQRPCFAGNRLLVRGEPEGGGRTVRLWSADHEGWQGMQATATLA